MALSSGAFMKKALGISCIVLGLGLLGYWGFRIANPTGADRQRLATMADTGSDPGNGAKIFLLGGIALLVTGGALSRR